MRIHPSQLTKNTHDRIFLMPFHLIVLSLSLLLLWSCGGDEPGGTDANAPATAASEELNNEPLEASLDPEPLPKLVEEEPEPGEIPDPNGVFLPIYEDNGGKLEMVKMNDNPVYTNGEGYYLWTNGSLWKITTKPGAGRTIASGGEAVVGSWPGGASARFSPDEEYAKQAMFRLAVAFQGSQDNENAIRLFQQFVTLLEDKLVAEVYLSMGDLATSGLGPDTQPNIKQIRQARTSYGKVRENTEEIGLISDSTANEGGLLERVGENPERSCESSFKL